MQINRATQTQSTVSWIRTFTCIQCFSLSLSPSCFRCSAFASIFGTFTSTSADPERVQRFNGTPTTLPRKFSLGTVFTLKYWYALLFTLNFKKIQQDHFIEESVKNCWMSGKQYRRWVANIIDPDQTPRSAASDLSLYCLLRPFLG